MAKNGLQKSTELGIKKMDNKEPLNSAEYTPEMWTVKKDDIYKARDALKLAMQYLHQCKCAHESVTQPQSPKEKAWLMRMDIDEGIITEAIDTFNNLPKPYTKS